MPAVLRKGEEREGLHQWEIVKAVVTSHPADQHLTSATGRLCCLWQIPAEALHIYANPSHSMSATTLDCT